MSGTGILRYRPEMTDAGMPTPIGCPPLPSFTDIRAAEVGGGGESGIWVSRKPWAEQVLFLTVQIVFMQPDY